jgi:hypothetical protein
MIINSIYSENEATALVSLIPPINRAREYRLYTTDGRRIVDLWQYGGRAVLGHNPPGVLRELKNSAERGLFAPLPHPRSRRLEQALAKIFPGRSFRIYADEASLRRALAAASFPVPGVLPDPAISAEAAFDGSVPVLWRPFLMTRAAKAGASVSIQDRLSRCPVLVPVLPLPWPCAPWVLALEAGVADRFPPSDFISPPVLAAASRSVLDLIAAFPEREKAVIFQKKISPNKSKWQLRGIYLYYKEALESSASSIFTYFLQQGFLTPPTRQDPVILPGLLSPGESAKLAKLLRE